MTVHFLDPAFVQIFYHSDFGVHIMTLPTKAYDSVDDTFATWGGTPKDSDDMILELIDKFSFLFPSTVSFDSYRIFSVGAPPDIPFLERAATITGKVGTASSPSWSKAVQGTLSALDSAGQKLRLTFLDSDSAGSFDAIFTLPGSGALFDLFAEWKDASNGWSSRNGQPPSTFLEYSKTLNEKLRREYRMF